LGDGSLYTKLGGGSKERRLFIQSISINHES
jgi:hypothetical protein